MAIPGEIFCERYEILRTLAHGGMAEVHLAHDRLLDRQVALKALFPEYAREESFVVRFRREAQAAANLNHPNIVGIYDWGQHEGMYFIVMEYVEGQSLRDILRSGGALPAARAAEIASEIAAALEYAHRHEVVHRDVKPGNVMITPGGQVKVTDFGIAHMGTSEDLTQTGSVMGTASYLSPEQAQGKPTDGRSDIYSMGVVLYEMATGVPPFAGDSAVTVAYKHVSEAPLPPSVHTTDLPRDLESIILTSLAKVPSQRYATAEDLRADLTRFRRGQPIHGVAATALIVGIGGDGDAGDGARGRGDDATTVHRALGDETTRIAHPGAQGLGARPGRGSSGDAIPTENPHQRKAPMIIALVVAVLVMGGIGFALTSQLSGDEKPAPIVVPDVADFPLDEAKAALEAKEFVVKVVQSDNDEIPKNVVVSQDPEAGAKLAKGGTVTLDVSKGPPAGKVPAVRGEDAADAEGLIRSVGFEVNKIEEPSDDLPKGIVLRTDPAEGVELDRGETVTIVISTGPEEKPVPDVSGMDEAEAFAAIRVAGFVDPLRIIEPSFTVPAGKVTRTDPPARELAATDRTIKLFISSGPARHFVPNVVGRTSVEARAELESKGFVAAEIEVASSAGNAGKVVSQDPTGNTEAEEGSTVTIYVGVAAVTTTGPATSTTAVAGTTTTTI